MEAASAVCVDARLSRILHLAHKHDAPAFDLKGLPEDLADALRAYDLDGDGTVSVSEIAAGAQLLHRQREKARHPGVGGRARGGQLQACAPVTRARARRTPRSAR